MDKKLISDFIRKQRAITANLEETNSDFWIYGTSIDYGEGYRNIQFKIPIDKVGSGFCSNMPAKYLLEFLVT